MLTNDTDPQEQPLRLVSFSTATNGVVTEADEITEGLLTYTPNAGFNGTDTFTYAVTGGDPSLVSTATVTIDVNQAPVVATNQLLVVSRNEIAEVSRAFLVAQDVDNASNEIIFQVIGGPQQGRLLRLGSNPETIVPGRSFSQANIDSGSLRYEAPGTSGEDGFLFTLTDGVGTEPQTLFSITIVDSTDTVVAGVEFPGSDSSEQIIGTDGDDTVLAGGGRDVVRGNAGNDSLDGGAGNDVLEGDEDNDTLLGQAGNDSLFGGPGNDSVDGGAGRNTLFGNDGNDTVVGQNDSNLLSGGNNNDSLLSGLGNDTLIGGAGNDTLNSGEGEDQLFGEAGEDLLFGGIGRDLLLGGEDNDTLQGQANDDTLFGGQGSDSLLGEAGDDTVLAGIGNDTVQGGEGDDSLFGEDGNDSLLGEAGSDTIFGGIGTDSLFGLDGNDLMFGDADNDTLLGGAGEDTIAGGAGSDQLTGNIGNDFFYYLTPPTTPNEADILTDFDQVGNDQFLIISGENNFPGLVSNVGTAASPLQREIVTQLGSQGTDISGKQLIIFEDTFDNIGAVNAAVSAQNGSNNSSALIVYRNNLQFPGFPGSYVLAFDPDLADDSLPAFNLGILASIDPSTSNISTLIQEDDFVII